MLSFQEFKRRGTVPLLLLLAAGYYALVYQPLRQRAENLDAPLDKAWRRLASSMGRSNVVALDFTQVSNQLAVTRQALVSLESARRAAAERMTLPEPVRNRFQAPFQLFEYQNELSRQLDRLDARAKQLNIGVDPPVFSGFPEYSQNVADPSLLWPALCFAEQLIHSALESRITAIHSLRTRMVPTHSTNVSDRRWTEIPIEMEFSSPASSALIFLRQLPFPNPAPATNASPSAPGVPLLIDSLVMRKQTPEKPDEVRLWVRVVGFVNRS